jgi:asparagine synthase (glutamine-hydrolysing)
MSRLCWKTRNCRRGETRVRPPEAGFTDGMIAVLHSPPRRVGYSREGQPITPGMCGIFGIVGCGAMDADRARRGAARAMAAMSHRGPDGSGVWLGPGVVLAHRRLAIVDREATGAQPMTTPDGRYTLVYNGELYNDAEIRAALMPEVRARGWSWSTTSDAQTVLYALAVWGDAARRRLRGMYAFGFFDVTSRRLVVARDQLGIKPLYYARCAGRVVFASEIAGVLSQDEVAARPDFGAVASYLVTIRTTIGARTLYEGVRTLRAGEWREFDASSDELREREIVADGADGWCGDGVAISDAALADVVEESVAAHLRADVPVCAMLSGGLDSSVIATLAKERVGALSTYAAGASGAGVHDDVAAAADVAAALETRHTHVEMTRERFAELWEEMTGRMGLPLSTPNETAIYSLASRMRRDGFVVALSGEGADELFAGYEGPMDAAHGFEVGRGGESDQESVRAGAAFQRDANAWTPRGALADVLRPEVFAAARVDDVLDAEYERVFAAARREAGGDVDTYVGSTDRSEPRSVAREVQGGGRRNGEHRSLRAAIGGTEVAAMCGVGLDVRVRTHLIFQRRVNLHGLLMRLDQATMLASIEGRTPLADVMVARAAAGMPLSRLYSAAGEGVRTKMALRRAFRGRVHRGALERPKASFPLPFQQWLGDAAEMLRGSRFAREVFTEAAVETVAGNAEKLWPLAWPMMNVAMWGRRW